MKRTLVSIIGAAALFAGSYGVASAASLADLQAQLQSLLAQIASLQSQQQVNGSWAIGSAFSATSTPGVAPDSCKVWYDGCNTCTRTTPGGPLACTTVQCIWNAGSSCKEYFDTTGSGSGGAPRICSFPYYRMAYGANGSTVSALQEFLQSEGVLSANATGYFGALTQAALQKWQANQGIVSSGSAGTTGWGTVGPATWRALQARCNPPTPTACTLEYKPVCGQLPGCANNPCTPGKVCNMMCLTHTPQTYGNRCQLDAAGARYLYDGACVNPDTNQPPTISGITGPTTLAVNQQGTWTVNASDPENQSLSYQVTWGDERVNPTVASGVASSPINYQTATFTHTYATAGTYTVQVMVTDAQGASSNTSITVTVGSPVVCTMEYAPVCGQPPEPACRHTYPQCMIATPGPQTYGNTCLMNAAGATLIHTGVCTY